MNGFGFSLLRTASEEEAAAAAAAEEASRQAERRAQFDRLLENTLPTPKYHDEEGGATWFRDPRGHDLLRQTEKNYVSKRLAIEGGTAPYDIKAKFIEVLPTFPTARDRSYIEDGNKALGGAYPEQSSGYKDGPPPHSGHRDEWNSEYKFGMPPFYDKYYRGYDNAFRPDGSGRTPLYEHIKHIQEAAAGCTGAAESARQNSICWVVDGANIFFTKPLDGSDFSDPRREFAPWSVKTTAEGGEETVTHYNYPSHAAFVAWKRDQILNGVKGDDDLKYGPVIVVIKEQSYQNLQYNHSFYGQSVDPTGTLDPAPDQRPYLIASLAPLHACKHPVIFVVAEAVTRADRNKTEPRAGALTEWALSHRIVEKETDGRQPPKEEKQCQWEGDRGGVDVYDHVWCEFDDFVAYRIVNHLREQGRVFTREGGDRDDGIGTLATSFKGLHEYLNKNGGYDKYVQTLQGVRGAFRIRVFGLNTHYVRAYSQMGFRSTVQWFNMQVASGGNSSDRLDDITEVLQALKPWADLAFHEKFPTKAQRTCMEYIDAIRDSTDDQDAKIVYNVYKRLLDRASQLRQQLLALQDGTASTARSSAPPSANSAGGGGREGRPRLSSAGGAGGAGGSSGAGGSGYSWSKAVSSASARPSASSAGGSRGGWQVLGSTNRPGGAAGAGAAGAGSGAGGSGGAGSTAVRSASARLLAPPSATNARGGRPRSLPNAR